MQKFSKQQVKSVGLKKKKNLKSNFPIFSLSKSKENWLDKTKLFFCLEVRILKKQQQTRTSNSRILRSKKQQQHKIYILRFKS